MLSLLAHFLACKHPVGKTAKSKPWKPSVAETKETMCVTVTDFALLQEDLSRVSARFDEKGLPVTPVIVVLGGQDPSGFTLWHKTFSFKFNSFLKALDVCLKLFKAYDISYPPQSDDIWSLLAGYLYEFDITKPAIAGLNRTLKRLAEEK